LKYFNETIKLKLSIIDGVTYIVIGSEVENDFFLSNETPSPLIVCQTRELTDDWTNIKSVFVIFLIQLILTLILLKNESVFRLLPGASMPWVYPEPFIFSKRLIIKTEQECGEVDPDRFQETFFSTLRLQMASYGRMRSLTFLNSKQGASLNWMRESVIARERTPKVRWFW
jgi:hypothetical protein